MRERLALAAVRRFVREKYPDFAHCRVEVALEQDGERKRSWSFGVHSDEEDEEEVDCVGYVHADGYVKGLY